MLILRAVSIEFRSHLAAAVAQLLDRAFAAAAPSSPSSSGAAIGTWCGACRSLRRLVRTHLVHELPAPSAVGILDWYTVLVGLFALVRWSDTGPCSWPAHRGPVHERSRAIARVVFVALRDVALATWATTPVNPGILGALPGARWPGSDS